LLRVANACAIGKVAVAEREMAGRERVKTKAAASSRAAELEKLCSARAEAEARVALDGEVILTPPCIFHS
jgi:hypothetical protein